MGLLQIMVGIDAAKKLLGPDATAGDTKQTWNPDNPAEVRAAKETFDKLRKEGFIAWSVKADGGQDQQITEFDPRAGRIIMSPPLRGGRA